MAEFQVRGDEGQALLFDLDVAVWGNGYQPDIRLCPHYLPGGAIDYREQTLFEFCYISIPPEYPHVIVPGKNFYYGVDMTVTCSDMAVGVDSDNRNELLAGYGEMTNKYRDVRLRVDKQGVYIATLKHIMLSFEIQSRS
ncbi:hypothetical protein [Thalassomonas sp. RHCl1]|uniref:hypothetical protein n=1 Tax=Thalassomonas sp. RHCl1 TaxID=2995320 RepID=UPI00248AE768|nr:hypothetical protein [Thalassomonas sp. RHCl1]